MNRFRELNFLFRQSLGFGLPGRHIHLLVLPVHLLEKRIQLFSFFSFRFQQVGLSGTNFFLLRQAIVFLFQLHFPFFLVGLCVENVLQMRQDSLTLGKHVGERLLRFHILPDCIFFLLPGANLFLFLQHPFGKTDELLEILLFFLHLPGDFFLSLFVLFEKFSGIRRYIPFLDKTALFPIFI